MLRRLVIFVFYLLLKLCSNQVSFLINLYSLFVTYSVAQQKIFVHPFLCSQKLSRDQLLIVFSCCMHLDYATEYKIKIYIFSLVIYDTTLIRCNYIRHHIFFYFQIVVSAYDKGTPPRTANQTITIRVEDINDNAPFFTHPARNNSTIYTTIKAKSQAIQIQVCVSRKCKVWVLAKTWVNK